VVIVTIINQSSSNTSIIAQSLIIKSNQLQGFEESKPSIEDTVELSKVANELQRTEQLTELSSTPDSYDRVKVTTTVGRSKSSANLSNNQAIELYQQIAKLL